MFLEELDNTPLTQAEVFHSATQSSVGNNPSTTADALRQKPKYALRAILHAYAIERNKIGYVDPVNHDFIYTSAVLERYPHLCEPHVHQRHCPHFVLTKRSHHHRSTHQDVLVDNFEEKVKESSNAISTCSQSLDASSANQKAETEREVINRNKATYNNIITSPLCNDSNTLSLVPSASDRSGQLLVETMAYRRRQGDLRRGGRSGRDRSGRAARSSQAKREKKHHAGEEEKEAIEEKLVARTRDFRGGACEWNEDINYESSGCSSITSASSSESSFSFSSSSSNTSGGEVCRQGRKNRTETKKLMTGGDGSRRPPLWENACPSLIGGTNRQTSSSSPSVSSFSPSSSSSSRRISTSSSRSLFDDEPNGHSSSSCEQITSKREGKEIATTDNRRRRKRESIKGDSKNTNSGLLVEEGTRVVESAPAETEIPAIVSQGRKEVLDKRDAPLDHIYVPPEARGKEARRREHKLLRLVNPALRPHSEPFLPQKAMPDIEDVRRLPRYAQSRRVHLAAMAVGADCYRDLYTGCVVFCKSFLSQVPCCGQQCRHCPYGHHALAFSPEQAASIIAKEVASKKTPYSCAVGQCEQGFPSILVGENHNDENPQSKKALTCTSPTSPSATAATNAFTPVTIVAHWVKEGFGGFHIAPSPSPSTSLQPGAQDAKNEVSSFAQQSGSHVHAGNLPPQKRTLLSPPPFAICVPTNNNNSATTPAASLTKMSVASAPVSEKKNASGHASQQEVHRKQKIALTPTSKEMIGINESQQKYQQVVSVNDLDLLLVRPANTNSERNTGGTHAHMVLGEREDHLVAEDDDRKPTLEESDDGDDNDSGASDDDHEGDNEEEEYDEDEEEEEET